MKKIKIVSLLALVMITAFSVCVMFGCTPGSSTGDSEADAYNRRLVASQANIGRALQVDDIFHDQADVFMTPLEPTDTDNVTIRLRVRRGNVSKASLFFTVELDKIADGTAKYHEIPMVFEIADVTEYFDYYICVIPAQVSPYKYHFRIENNGYILYYNQAEKDIYASDDPQAQNPTISHTGDFYVMPNFAVPDWSKGTIWYSLMPDSFYNADTLTDKTSTGPYKQDAWGTTHFTSASNSGGLSYFGGDLLGVEEQIEYFKSLNVDAVFLNPIWLAYHNAGYGAADMMQIDSTFGNDNMLTQLTAALHANNMKIMLDGVFTYFTWTGTWYNQNGLFPLPGANNEGDPYYEVYQRSESGQIPTVWGNPRTDFSNKLTRELVYSSPSSVMQYYILNHGIDGWRLDVGGDLQGTVKGQWETPTQIMQDMRRYLKDIDEDVLLCSEGASGTMLTDYALDTFWNFDYYYNVKAFLEYDTTTSALASYNKSLYTSIMSLPRQIANASYNFTANHDMPRALYASKGDVAKSKATAIVNFTFAGAPVIYYGDEVGLANTSFFDTMNWDKSTWNYEFFNLYRALTGVRTDYKELFKDGVLMDLGLEESDNMIGYARWKGNDKCVVLMNPFDRQVDNFELNVRSLELKNGDVLYDYLTGRTYTVQNGKVSVDVASGGAVLVNGKGNNWAGIYEVKNIGSSQNGWDSYVEDGMLKLTGNSDVENPYLAYLPVFNNAEVKAELAFGQGSYALVLRADESKDAPFYAIVLDATGNGKVVYRLTKGGEVQTVKGLSFAEGESVSVQRKSNNTFVAVRYAKDGTATELTTTEAYIPTMDWDIIGGVAPISGETTLANISVKGTADQMATEFDKIDSMSLTLGNPEKIVINNGTLTLKGDASVQAWLAPSHMTDISAKAKLTSTPVAGFTGVTVWQSENNYLFVGRMTESGKTQLVFGQVLNGSVNKAAAIDNVEGDLYVQIEKIGQYFYAKYSTDDQVYQSLGCGILSNYSEMYAGCVNTDSADATFDWFCFGDSIHAEGSSADHQFYGELNYSAASYDGAQVYLSTTGGIWEYCPGGLKQTHISATKAQLNCGSNIFESFKADFTLQLIEAGSFSSNVSFLFGVNKGIDNGAVVLDRNGMVSLTFGDQTLASYQIKDFSNEKQYRFVVVMNQDKKVTVFLGEEPVAILQESMPAYVKGTQKIVGYKTCFTVTSSNFFHYYRTWNYAEGSVMVPVSDYIILNNTTTSRAALLNGGVSDVLMAANVQISPQRNRRYGKFAFYLDATAGATVENEGYLVGAEGNGTKTRVYVESLGERLAEKEVDCNNLSFYLIVAVVDGKVEIYVDKYSEGAELGLKNYSKTPVLTYDIGHSVGGALQVYSYQASVTLARLRVYGLQAGEDYKQLPIFTDRMIEIDERQTPAKEDAFELAGVNKFSWDFS
ncbi:MAG: alpha amylase N-terminal ig-like domain-containing protein, partial [Clostridia bacterium]|nr:alpha amylase N-terminal ig-like domain-containing protein [Clostridia bacterium]